MEKPLLRLGDKGKDVEEWQKLLFLHDENVKPDGDFGIKTEAATKRFQDRNGLIPDGVVGDNTWYSARKGLIVNGKPMIPENQEDTHTEDYRKLNWQIVVGFESGGREYYNRYLKNPSVPGKGVGSSSGVTIGVGVDFGYLSKQEFNKYMEAYFTNEQSGRLKSVIGFKGRPAYSVLYKVKGIELSWENANKIFVDWTLPKFWNLANGIWPGMDNLCDEAKVALTGLVFNRGSSLRGGTRREMQNIVPLVKQKDYEGIAREVRSMKRLWMGKGLDGLLLRRDKEADMIASCGRYKG